MRAVPGQNPAYTIAAILIEMGLDVDPDAIAYMSRVAEEKVPDDGAPHYPHLGEEEGAARAP